MKIVSVYGSSAPADGSAAYAEAMGIGRQLAEAGFTVATGGYRGVMEAASRGAATAGGHVIGVTCSLLENWREGLSANAWVKEEIKFGSLRERLYHLVEFCDAAVALGGGVGTLSEVALTWSLLQTGEIRPKPLILVGLLWRDSISTFLSHADGYVRPEHRALLSFVKDVDEAVAMLKG
ncbi:MAG: LOG family protein [Chloroflexi bacterium]|nr:LOG family protein [Chloroflexota bacterium]MBI3176792.1 LOG family protein [Chloroflexota bacterium]